LGANLIFYNASGIDNRMDPFAMVFSGNASLKVYGIELPFYFRLSNKSTDFQQPFNQFGLSPSYKWITVHAGYRNVKFSDFTLAGHTFLGGGIELHPGLLRLGAVYGRFKKNSGMFENERDTLKTFDRKGFAVKLGVGSRKNYFDLILMNIKDDSLSLKSFHGADGVTPQQNVVTGMNSFFTFSKALTFEAEAALSVYTTDASIRRIDDLENLKALEKVNRFIVLNESSELTTAARAALGYKTKRFGLRAEYRRIDPKYKSMGAYYFNDDVQSFTLAPSLPLFKKKLYLRGSIGLQSDNLRKTKIATTKRTISSVNISFNPGQVFGLDINYGNYSHNQTAGRLPVIDSVKVYQTTSNLSISPRLMFNDDRKSQMIFFMFNRSGLNDKNAATAEHSESVATILNLSYNINFTPLMLGISAGLNHTLLENFTGENKVSGVTAGVNKSWLKGLLNLGFNTSAMRSSFLSEKGWIYNQSLFTNYQLIKHHNFKASVYLTTQKYPDGSVNKSFNEFKGDLSYVYTF